MTLASVYQLNNVAIADVYRLLEKYQPEDMPHQEEQNFVFIIDEINRGNISKIFGELITLIETSKRVGEKEGMRLILPYSQKAFGVPKNVYVIGTMNTADRSIAVIDTALRRRFAFREMMPKPAVLAGVNVDGIAIDEMLVKMNQRICALYDREHTIGHAYFIPLKEMATIEKLAEIFRNSIIPLLQEYFYEDYRKIRWVLGDHKKNDAGLCFILKKENSVNELFGDIDYEVVSEATYEINQEAFLKIESYQSI